MEITNEQYRKIVKYLPVQRGNVKISNFQLINAILYVAENGVEGFTHYDKLDVLYSGFVLFVMIVDTIV